MGDMLPGEKNSYAYLMQFVDDKRIDLTLYPRSRLDEMGRDSLIVLLQRVLAGLHLCCQGVVAAGDVVENLRRRRLRAYLLRVRSLPGDAGEID